MYVDFRESYGAKQRGERSKEIVRSSAYEIMCNQLAACSNGEGACIVVGFEFGGSAVGKRRKVAGQGTLVDSWCMCTAVTCKAKGWVCLGGGIRGRPIGLRRRQSSSV